MYMYTQTNTVSEKKKHLKKLKQINLQIVNLFYNIFIQVLQEVDDLCYVINTIPLLYIF